MKFIDSNIIAYAFYENELQRQCQNAIREGGIINALVLVEAFNIIEYNSSRTYATQVIRSLLKSSLQIIPVDVNVIFETIKQTEKQKELRFIDLLHYITALQYNCEAILSYDKDFDRKVLPREEPT